MYSYYLQKGHALESLLSLSSIEKIFYSQSMALHMERENICPMLMVGDK